ncbi:GNAT family N-acetyltransferase [Leifsonia sp. LS1]|uniref:GNAT family N-acetyltransferase n=1 Tax=Leifsonia sp. LS1 TaxID=2828483 RepID=UPI001CFE050D|nr:GNAT family N-acetyltransferase [Leifsonia sp. LS1]GIT79352.1 GNAT family N-acetyltransferase [Leifsonia sp. LS1]
MSFFGPRDVARAAVRGRWSGLEIRRLTPPERLGTPESAAFEELVGVLNGIVYQLWGDDDFVETAEEALAGLREQDYLEKIVLVAVEEGAIVGRVEADFPLDQDAETVSLLVDVVPALRSRGIGSALLAAGEELAAEGGRTVVSAYTEHPVRSLPEEGAWVHAPAGSAGLPAEDPGVRFALRHGYRLGQIERSSELVLPLPPVRAVALASTAATADGYRVVSWFGAAPDDLLDSFAALKERMVVDVPHSGIALDREAWTGDRVRAQERELAARGEPLLVTAAQCEASGDLAAYTEIAVPADGEKAEQYDTLVAADHRGHRLGTLVKLHNIHELARCAPHITRLLTWNADENAPMIAINRAFGFRPHALTGTWQKRLG